MKMKCSFLFAHSVRLTASEQNGADLHDPVLHVIPSEVEESRSETEESATKSRNDAAKASRLYHGILRSGPDWHIRPGRQFGSRAQLTIAQNFCAQTTAT